MGLLFIKGFLLGLAVAAPIGPIGVLCIQRSLRDGFKVGLMAGMGAALANGTYGLIAGLSLTALSSFLVAQQFWIRLGGGLFLLYLGIKTFLTPSQEKSTQNTAASVWYAFGTTYLLTLANPATILAFIAIFAGFSFNTVSASHAGALILVLGITLGSAVWWLLLSGGVCFFLYHRFNSMLMRKINRYAGSIIFVFGLLALPVFSQLFHYVSIT